MSSPSAAYASAKTKLYHAIMWCCLCVARARSRYSGAAANIRVEVQVATPDAVKPHIALCGRRAVDLRFAGLGVAGNL